MKDWKDNSYHKKQRKHRNKTNTQYKDTLATGERKVLSEREKRRRSINR